MKKMVVILALGLFIGNASASEKEDFESLAQKQTDVLESTSSTDAEEVFFLNKVAVRTRLDMEVELPWIAKLSIEPEIELHWTR